MSIIAQDNVVCVSVFFTELHEHAYMLLSHGMKKVTIYKNVVTFYCCSKFRDCHCFCL